MDGLKNMNENLENTDNRHIIDKIESMSNDLIKIYNTGQLDLVNRKLAINLSILFNHWVMYLKGEKVNAMETELLNIANLLST